MKISDIDRACLDKLDDFLREAERVEMADKSALLLPALKKSQELFSYIPEFAQDRISFSLKIKLSDIIKVIDAYPYLTTKAVAQTRVSLCGGPVCYRRGIIDINDKLRKEFEIEDGCDVTKDNSVSVSMTLCKGQCRNAPMGTINQKVYYNLEAEQFCEVVKKLQTKNNTPEQL